MLRDPNASPQTYLNIQSVIAHLNAVERTPDSPEPLYRRPMIIILKISKDSFLKTSSTTWLQKISLILEDLTLPSSISRIVLEDQCTHGFFVSSSIRNLEYLRKKPRYNAKNTASQWMARPKRPTQSCRLALRFNSSSTNVPGDF